jgi:hypothetical protein
MLIIDEILGFHGERRCPRTKSAGEVGGIAASILNKVLSGFPGANIKEF